MCLAKHHGDSVNYGFADYKKAEKIIESYDYELHYGTLAPYYLYFKDGTAYHMQNANYNTREIIKFFGNATANARWIEPIRPARNELNIFVQYIYKDVANLRKVNDAYNWVRENYPESWFFKEVLGPNFSRVVPKKTQGWKIVTFVIIPTALITLYIAHLIVKMIWRCLGCSKKKDEGGSKTTPAPNKKPQREKID